MRQLLIPALILVVVAGAAVGFQENSQGQLKRPANEGLARAVDDLQKKLQSLRADVDYLLVPEKYNQEETGYLETLVRSREAIYKKILPDRKAGMKPTYDEALARYHLHAARAHLAWAKGDVGRCQKEWEPAILVAKTQLEVMRVSYEAGRVGLNRVREAQAQLADAQLNLSKIKRKIAWKQNRR